MKSKFAKLTKVSVSVLAIAALAGCSSAPERMGKFNYEPNYPVNIPTKSLPQNGSLYQSGESLSLFDDLRAHRIGDIITINLAETMDANKKDAASYNRSNELNFGEPTVFGKTIKDVGIPGLNTLAVGAQNENAFSGSSDVKQNSSLTGAIAVTVVEVIPNGNLVIRGEKWITIHDGEEVVRFAGIIRPQDISPENTIDSEKVADVRIIYKDTGISGDNARAGAVSKFLAKFWPI